jgi:hypothetical protein
MAEAKCYCWTDAVVPGNALLDGNRLRLSVQQDHRILVVNSTANPLDAAAADDDGKMKAYGRAVSKASSVSNREEEAEVSNRCDCYFAVRRNLESMLQCLMHNRSKCAVGG